MLPTGLCSSTRSHSAATQFAQVPASVQHRDNHNPVWVITETDEKWKSPHLTNPDAPTMQCPKLKILLDAIKARNQFVEKLSAQFALLVLVQSKAASISSEASAEDSRDFSIVFASTDRSLLPLGW